MGNRVQSVIRVRAGFPRAGVAITREAGLDRWSWSSAGRKSLNVAG